MAVTMLTESTEATIISEIASLVGPELLMIALGAVCYLLFSGNNMLCTYWSYYDSLFPGRQILPHPDTTRQGDLAKKGKKTAEPDVEQTIFKGEEKVEDPSPLDLAAAPEAAGEEIELAEDPVSAPARKDGEDHQDATEEEVGWVLVEESMARPSCPILQALTGGLHTDLRAQVFLYLELTHVGKMASTCRAARANIWEDAPLWVALGGANFPRGDSDVLGPAPLQPAKPLREQFRVWVYGLGAGWSDSFAASAMSWHHQDVFDEAWYLLGGLKKTDGTNQIEAFADCVTEQLMLLDAGEEKANQAAVRFLEKAKTRQELFGEARLMEMQQAFESSTKHALILAKHARRGLGEEEEEEAAWNPFDGMPEE